MVIVLLIEYFFLACIIELSENILWLERLTEIYRTNLKLDFFYTKAGKK